MKIKYLIIIGVISLISCCLYSSQISATGSLDATTEEFFAQNNILFFEPCSTSSYSGSMCGNTAEQKIWSGLRKFLSPEQAAGAIGNMKNEGGLNPVCHEGGNNDGPGLGLIQWTGGRRDKMLEYVLGKNPDLQKYFDNYSEYSYCAGYGTSGFASGGDALINKEGINMSDVDQLFQYELEFLQQEIESYDVYNGILNQQTVEDAAFYWSDKIEACGLCHEKTNQTVQNRISAAQITYDTLKDFNCGSSNSSTSITSASASGKYDCNEGGGNAISQQAINLAWPEGTENGRPQTPKSEFSEAANKVGTDSSKPDCGVFVATVILSMNIDSEFPKISTETQQKHMEQSPLWDEVENKSENYMPGDIFINNDHTFIFLGNDKKAEASLDENYSVIHPLSWDIRPISSYKIFRLKSDNNTLSQTNNGIQCGCVDSSNGTLKDGGYSTVEEAEQAIMVPYANDSLSDPFFNGLPDWQSGGIHSNCVAFSEWFLFTNTTIDFRGQRIPGNGVDIAGNFYNRFKDSYPELSMSSTPSVYSVASWKEGEMRSAVSPEGHTGIIVGINQSENKILVAEAGFGNPDFTGVHEYTIDELNGHGQYVNINAYMKGGTKK